MTLIELLIVLALLIATAAIVYPAVAGRFERTRFEATVEQVSALISLGRAEAQRSGKTMQIVWDQRRRQARIEPFDLDSLLDEENGGPAAQRDDGRRNAAPRRNDPLRVVLPEGFRISTTSAPGSAGRNAFDTESRRRDFDFDFADDVETSDRSNDAPRRLAILLPDGSALFAEPITITSTAQRRATITINPWTGLTSISYADSRVADERDDEGDAFDFDREFERGGR